MKQEDVRHLGAACIPIGTVWFVLTTPASLWEVLCANTMDLCPIIISHTLWLFLISFVVRAATVPSCVLLMVLSAHDRVVQHGKEVGPKACVM